MNHDAQLALPAPTLHLSLGERSVARWYPGHLSSAYSLTLRLQAHDFNANHRGIRVKAIRFRSFG
jgi:hypothetical protein